MVMWRYWGTVEKVEKSVQKISKRRISEKNKWTFGEVSGKFWEGINKTYTTHSVRDLWRRFIRMCPGNVKKMLRKCREILRKYQVSKSVYNVSRKSKGVQGSVEEVWKQYLGSVKPRMIQGQRLREKIWKNIVYHYLTFCLCPHWWLPTTHHPGHVWSVRIRAWVIYQDRW